MKVFLTMHAGQPVVGDSKPKYEPFITHNRGALKKNSMAALNNQLSQWLLKPELNF